MLDAQDLLAEWIELFIKFPRQLAEKMQPSMSWIKAYLHVTLGLLMVYGVKILVRLYGETCPPEIDLNEVTDNCQPT